MLHSFQAAEESGAVSYKFQHGTILMFNGTRELVGKRQSAPAAILGVQKCTMRFRKWRPTTSWSNLTTRKAHRVQQRDYVSVLPAIRMILPRTASWCEGRVAIADSHA
jgi:hypothetical protein